MNTFFRRNLLALSILSAMLAGQAYAQGSSGAEPVNASQASVGQTSKSSTTQTDASKKKVVQLQAVTVTAEHRAEQVQKVPISISVISGVQLDRLQVKDLKDVKFAVPNITLQNNTGLDGGLAIFMRGIGQDESMFTTDPGVAIYINDVYIPRSNGALLDLYDVERIEVLRGPQGTLYGRNATGGAIRYITKEPTGKNYLTMDTTLGNYGRTDAQLKFGTHIGKLNISAAVLSRNRDGYMHDLTHDREVNNQRINAARTTLAMQMSDSTYATLNLDYLRNTSGPIFPTPVTQGSNGKPTPVLGSFYDTRTDILGEYYLTEYGAALTTDTDFGSFSLRNIFHTRGMRNRLFIDVDGTEQTRFHLFQNQKQRQYGYEAQLASEIEGPFSWVGGFFSFRETNSQPTRQDIFATGNTNDVSLQTNALALYWQGKYAVTDRLNLIAGARYSWERKNFLVVSTHPDGSPNFTAQMMKIWKRPDWKVGLDYDFADHVMGYATVTTGFKSGGFNGRAQTLATATAVNAETVRAYEIGVKSSLVNDRVRLNVDYYRNDYASMQQSANNPEGILTLFNATGALIEGVEMDAQVQLTRQWHVAASFGTINAHYQNFAASNNNIFLGMKLKDAPNFQWSLSTDYVQPLATADLVFSTSLRYTDFFYQDIADTRAIMAPAHLEAQARIAYNPNSKNWSLALWGKNLTNNHTSTGGFNIPPLGMEVFYPAIPRTYGVEFMYRFW